MIDVGLKERAIIAVELEGDALNKKVTRRGAGRNFWTPFPGAIRCGYFSMRWSAIMLSSLPTLGRDVRLRPF
jgi:hypothetical protein